MSPLALVAAPAATPVTTAAPAATLVTAVALAPAVAGAAVPAVAAQYTAAVALSNSDASVSQRADVRQQLSWLHAGLLFNEFKQWELQLQQSHFRVPSSVPGTLSLLERWQQHCAAQAPAKLPLVHALASELQLCATAARDRCAAVGQTVGQTVDDQAVLKHWKASVHHKASVAEVQLQQVRETALTNTIKQLLLLLQ
jgi:hypothetical protein